MAGMLSFRRITKIAIANPCSESWGAMGGGDRSRFCTVCNRFVHDLSVLTRRQAADLFHKQAGNICGRIHYDERGNQIFAKERTAVERFVQISVLGASAVASAAAAQTCEVKVRVLDPTGATIPSATVKIEKPDGAEAINNGASNDQGEFSGKIAPGVYSLQVASPGFASFRQELTCRASETVSVKAPLRLAFMGEIIEVKPERSLMGKLRSLFARL